MNAMGSPDLYSVLEFERTPSQHRAQRLDIAQQYRRMLSDVRHEYLEFSRPPYAVDPLDEQLVKQARLGGVTCRLLIEAGTLDTAHRQRLEEYASSGVEVAQPGPAGRQALDSGSEQRSAEKE